jgi:hypothetical protein
MQEARIELLQRMSIFGGIRADTLQFLLAFCPIVSVATNEFFFREHQGHECDASARDCALAGHPLRTVARNLVFDAHHHYRRLRTC